MNDQLMSRVFTKDDAAFIYSSWLKSYWELGSGLENIRKSDFFKYHVIQIDQVLPYAQVLLICPKEDPEVILGYLVGDQEKPVLHYLYVKEAFRNEGIANQLISEFKPKIAKVTHLTNSKAFMHLFKKHEWDYVPYLF